MSTNIFIELVKIVVDFIYYYLVTLRLTCHSCNLLCRNLLIFPKRFPQKTCGNDSLLTKIGKIMSKNIHLT